MYPQKQISPWKTSPPKDLKPVHITPPTTCIICAKHMSSFPINKEIKHKYCQLKLTHHHTSSIPINKTQILTTQTPSHLFYPNKQRNKTQILTAWTCTPWGELPWSPLKTQLLPITCTATYHRGRSLCVCWGRRKEGGINMGGRRGASEVGRRHWGHSRWGSSWNTSAERNLYIVSQLSAHCALLLLPLLLNTKEIKIT